MSLVSKILFIQTGIMKKYDDLRTPSGVLFSYFNRYIIFMIDGTTYQLFISGGCII